MTITTLLEFLIGRRRAILQIAQTPHTLWLGLLLVFSAAFAREYDAEDLLHAPWHLAMPLAASLVTSGLLFTLVLMVSGEPRPDGRVLPGAYRSFLSLYWMTAPLAWLYAIPVERLATAEGATAANLWLLGIVATWRVVLMVRVVTVLYEARIWDAICVVMLFAVSVALAVLYLTPLPIISIMGGIRLSESERLIQNATLLIAFFGVISLPIWFVGTIMVGFRQRLSWRTATAALSAGRRVAGSAWVLAVAALLVWIPMLAWTQPEQQRRRQVESDLRAGRISQALAKMSAHRPGDFPPHWDPPPRIGYGEQRPSILEILEVLAATEVEPWVAEIYEEKFHRRAGYGFWQYLDEDQFDRYLTLLEQMPPDSPLIARQRERLTEQLSRLNRPEAQRARLQTLLQRRREPGLVPVDLDGLPFLPPQPGPNSVGIIDETSDVKKADERECSLD